MHFGIKKFTIEIECDVSFVFWLVNQGLPVDRFVATNILQFVNA
jgi:hypothetical protein